MGEDRLREIAAMVREHLAWEDHLGGVFLPPFEATESTDHGETTASSAAGSPLDRSGEPNDPSGVSQDANMLSPSTWAPPEADLRPASTPRPASVSTPSSVSTPRPASASAPPPGSELSAAAPAPELSAAAPSPPTPEPIAARRRLDPEERQRRLDVLAQEVAQCTGCRLHETRTQTVFSRGSASAEVAFVGEGPGFHEDQQGFPFVGKAGQLLDRMIAAMGYRRDEVYVCNVVKCRPPENRTPLPDEAAACEPFLVRQLDLVAPQVIVALGRCAADNLRGTAANPQSPWRGVWSRWREIPMMSTYHPAFLLRSPEMKRPVWEDLQKVLERLGRKAPSRK